MKPPIHTLKSGGKLKKNIYCSYAKKTGKDTSPTGRLWSFEDREQKWNLIKRLEKKEPLPDLVKGVGRDDDSNEIIELQADNKWKNFLRHNPAWQKLEEQHQNLVPYVWRHSYANKAHTKFRLSVPEVAFLMRNSVDVHSRNYPQFVTDDNIEVSVEAAIAESEKKD